MEFGQNVLEWLGYGEQSVFTSFKEEIMPNINVNNMEQKCSKLMEYKAYQQYNLNELMSIKIYTDCEQYQSKLRRAFWSSSCKATKRLYYQWALQLYKTTLYHATPKSITLYHGMYT